MDRNETRAGLAAHAVSGILAAGGAHHQKAEEVARRAVKIADAVLAELAKPEEETIPASLQQVGQLGHGRRR